MASIPHIDMSRYDTDFDAFVQDIGQGYESFGFVALTQHGIADEVIHGALDISRELFAQPEDVKKQYHLAGKGGARGYTPFGTEIAKDAKHVDLKEFWHVGRELEGEAPYPQLQPNVWPEEVPQFKPRMLSLYQALDTLGNKVLDALAVYLKQPRDFFRGKVNLGNSILRPLHYPPIVDEGTPSVRAAAHEDINVLTLLVGSREPGLEVLAKDGSWIEVTIIEGAIICNIGDMLQRLTNYLLPSTTHRVVNPPAPFSSSSRYSIPFFLHFNPDVIIDALDSCVSEDRPKRDPAISADDYLMERLREIGLIK
ncbi:2-oxoglutarate and iron-dependent oxygenase domain-containing protein [Gallaecimonas kandeliae]|uniref:isopenicillin N synthase family dioxygenase n=1 Tax=Gallaecimonas kandeliae TaxID=3029055 RepID=UPI0026483155|nr:2-oxoglutarate and iron-dependent oxygenase domain-containing protein [Gallaecimonas kandeliae]WKE66878.1 2-oxoglutarate and iron-dependent oxygenase domain-containing protein [Gallaecimonas kandeliae]